MRETMVVELMQGSLESSMGEHLTANNKLAYSGHQTLPISPDLIKSGQPARGLLLGDLDSPRSLRSLWFSNYPCNPCVPPQLNNLANLTG